MKNIPILILPGTLCTEAMFQHQITQLTQYCNNVAVVQFTTENTLAEMAEKVINAANDKPCALIGFSMGGIVAMEIAKTRPDVIAKLALINSNSHADLPERKSARTKQIKQVKRGELLELLTTTFLPNYLYKANPEHEKLITEMALTLGADCFEAQVKAIEDRPDSLKVLQSLNTDLLIIAGKEDKICPASHQQHMHQALPASQLELIDQCGHFSPLEQANEVSRLLTDWYNS